jgi:hypothetical protein
MTFEGGCYCGKIRYVAQGEPRLKAQCHCRECQYISGGAPNMFMLMPPEGFRYLSGTPKAFTRTDLEQPVTREFCETCGTHIATRRPGLNAVILKVGTLDDPSLFGAPQMAIYAVDRQPFHISPRVYRSMSDCPRGYGRGIVKDEIDRIIANHSRSARHD